MLVFSGDGIDPIYSCAKRTKEAAKNFQDRDAYLLLKKSDRGVMTGAQLALSKVLI